jgi:hypothetical protein
MFSVTGLSGMFNPGPVVSPNAGNAASIFTPTTTGAGTITVSASGLTGAGASLAVSKAAPQRSLFTTQTPAVANASDQIPYELGMRFRVARSGQILAVRYWKSANDTGTHVGRIWSASGALLAAMPFLNETSSGWQEQALETALPVTAGATYVVSVNIQSSYAFTLAGLATPITNGDISSVADGNNGVYGTPGAFPTSSYQSSNYFRDIVFVGDTFGTATTLALTPVTTSTQTSTPVSYTATVQDAIGNTVSTAANPITFTFSGVAGSFNPLPPGLLC